MKKLNPRDTLVIAGGATLILGAFIYGGYRLWELTEWKKFLEAENVRLKQSLTLTENYLLKAKENISLLSGALTTEQDKNRTFEAQIRDISGTVSTLQKLSQLDPELLKKYSKVYFLSENYAPAQLSAIDSEYIYDKNKTQLILSPVKPYLESMLNSARRDGVTLKVFSAYRSFYDQAAVKSGYKVLYGSGANQFSADQGYSEHQLGTTCDFTTPEIGGPYLSFEKSAAYKWLIENAYKFGFVLSYPKNNLYYQFEPWHWRFVGVALATKLKNENKQFYELSQREIDEYLISIFD